MPAESSAASLLRGAGYGLLLGADCPFGRDNKCLSQQSEVFFPRVRTPCGHGAQVIIEGREKQSDGGEKDKDPTTKQPQTTAHRPSLHHLVVFPLC